MILELVQARGIKAWLNGRVPVGGWSYDDSEVPGEITICQSNPLQFVKVQEDDEECTVVSILPDKPLEDIILGACITAPTKIVLKLTDREVTLKVTKVVIGDADAYDEESDEYGIKVRLVNGEDFFVDEISVYIRAES